jgi:Gram-negative porin
MRDTPFRAISVAWLAILFLGIFTSQSKAIPLFARKYHVSCFRCHTVPPVLNDFGRRFQINGYQLPGTDESEPIWSQEPLSLSFVFYPSFVSAHTVTTTGNTQSTSDQLSFEPSGLDLFTAGTIAKHLSYFLAAPIGINGPGQYSPSIETMSIMFNNLLGPDGQSNLNFRFGRYRLWNTFPDNTSLVESADYLIYDYDPAQGSLLIAEPQWAASVYGFFPQTLDGLRYEVAVSNGTDGGAPFKNNEATFFMLEQTEYVDNAPFRLGVYYYGGKELAGGNALDNLGRMGFAVEANDPWTKRFDLMFQYMNATDDNIGGAKQTMDGGFVGLNVLIVPEKFFIYGRYDFTKVTQTSEKQSQYTGGIRYHFAANVGAYAELSYLDDNAPAALTDTKTTLSTLGVMVGF